MDLNKVAVRITKKEGGKRNLTIGDVKEVMGLFLKELQKDEVDALKTIRRYKGRGR